MSTTHRRRAVRARAGFVAAVSLLPLVTAGPGAEAAVPRCQGQRATLVGTAHADVIRGTSRNDVIVARGGADRIDGRGGHDVICAGAGNDTVTGGPGRDRVDAGSGSDVVHGGGGDDTVRAGSGTDTCDGGAGTDTCDGGTPGAARDNAPDNPDRCTAESTLSCKDGKDLFYAGNANGTIRDESTNETETWSASFEKLGSHPSRQVGPITIDYSVEGGTGDCTWSGAGTFVGEVVLVAGPFVYSIDVNNPRDASVPVTYDCGASSGTRQRMPLRGGDAYAEHVWPQDRAVLAGSSTRVDPMGTHTDSWTWRLTR